MSNGTRRITPVRSVLPLAVALVLAGALVTVVACESLNAEGAPATGTSLAGVTTTEVAASTTVPVDATSTTAGGSSPAGSTTTTRHTGGTTGPTFHATTTTVTAPAPGYSWHRYEESDSRLAWGGDWGALQLPGASGRAVFFASSEASVKLSFEGKKIRLYAAQGETYGSVDIVLDYDEPSERWFAVDLYSPTPTDSALVWTSPALDPGAHRLKIEWSGKQNPAASANYINFDAVEVFGNLL